MLKTLEWQSTCCTIRAGILYKSNARAGNQAGCHLNLLVCEIGGMELHDTHRECRVATMAGGAIVSWQQH